MNENKTMITHFIKITNGLSSLGDSIDNDQKVRRVIRALQFLEVKSTIDVRIRIVSVTIIFK